MSLTIENLLQKFSLDLQSSFDIYDTNLVNSGTLSVLANTLANIAFDANRYYEFITQEINVSTCQTFAATLFHSNVYNYTFKLATPATVEGYLVIPEPQITSTEKWVMTIPIYTSVALGDTAIPFRTTGEIEIEYKYDSGTSSYIMSAVYIKDNRRTSLSISQTTENGKKYFLVLFTANILEQKQRYIFKYVVPKYNTGDRVTFNATIEDKSSLSSMNFYLNPASQSTLQTTQFETISLDKIPTTLNVEELEIKLFRFNVSPQDKVVFVEYKEDFQNLSFTLGNGIYGAKLIFNDEIFLVAETSLGSQGNIETSEGLFNNLNSYIIDTFTNNTVSSYTANYQFLMAGPAHGGADSDTIESIKYNIMRKMTERESLITPIDYMKYFGDPNKLAVAVSKQLDTINQMVLIYKEFRDMYDNSVIATLPEHYQDNNFISNTVLDSPVITVNSIDYVSPFVYLYINDRAVAYYNKQEQEIELSVNYVNSAYELNPKIYIYYDTVDGKHKFRGDTLTGYHYKIYSTIGEYTLDTSNSFETEIDATELFNGQYRKDPFYINRVDIVDDNTGSVVHQYDVTYSIEPMVKIQNHKIYNYNGDDYILYMPFIDKDYYDSMIAEDGFELYFIGFFKVTEAINNNLIPYNIDLNQIFADTVRVNSVIENNIILNENSDVVPIRDIDIQVLCDMDALAAAGLNSTDVQLEIKLFVLEYLNKNEGINCAVYRTDLVQGIKDLFPGIIAEVYLNSPLSFVVRPFDEILNKESPADPWDSLNLHPTYFTFNYNNMVINISKYDA